MCGIHAVIEIVSRLGVAVSSTAAAGGGSDCLDRRLSDVLRRRLGARGPDHVGQVAALHTAKESGCEYALSMTSTVLALRGRGLTTQPFVDPATGSVLCWNGEIWALGDEDVCADDSGDDGDDDAENNSEDHGNDGARLFRLLTAASKVASEATRGTTTEAARETVLDILRAIRGPFAIVYYDRPSGYLYYARDRLGRRSLLVQADAVAGRLVLSSVTDDDRGSSAAAAWAEVPADGIYAIHLESPDPWLVPGDGDGVVDGNTGKGGLVDRSSSIAHYDWAATHADATDPLMVGGIGRFNMANTPPPDTVGLVPGAPAVHALHAQLVAALRVRLNNIPRPPVRVPLPTSPPGVVAVDMAPKVIDTPDTRVAVLFSGGLDCTVLARMAHDVLPSAQGIDLVNVAFENPRVAAHRPLSAVVDDIFEACPDRVTGRASWAELQRVCPGRTWRFIAVNVSYQENLAHRPEIVALMHPHNTEMDLSIASALYFAARGTGLAGNGLSASASASSVSLASAKRIVTTPARVLLSGLGADELFGGYGRHAVAFSRAADAGPAAAYEALVTELRLDVARLGQRNLGRDDRVLSHWGRETRFPFLDENLVRWAMAQPPWAKCDFGNPGSTDQTRSTDSTGSIGVDAAKRVLRLLALELGMTSVAREKKRAIQFGARTAKMESGRVKGTALIT